MQEHIRTHRKRKSLKQGHISQYKIVYWAEDVKCTIFRTPAQGSHVPTVIDRNAQVQYQHVHESDGHGYTGTSRAREYLSREKRQLKKSSFRRFCDSLSR